MKIHDQPENFLAHFQVGGGRVRGEGDQAEGGRKG